MRAHCTVHTLAGGGNSEQRVHESDYEAGLPRNGASVGQAVLRLTVNASEKPEKSSSS